MKRARAWAEFFYLLIAACPLFALPMHPSVYSDECSTGAEFHDAALKSSVFRDKPRGFRAYGELLIRRSERALRCTATYRLWTARAAGPFAVAKSVEFDLEEGQIAGIELIGFSPDGAMFAADFLWAEGDGTVHHPVVLNRKSRQAADKELGDQIHDRIHVHGCDQMEDFIGVTNAGEAVFAVPPSIYDDSPECGDKGVWRFNLKTGRVHRVAKISGVKWR